MINCVKVLRPTRHKIGHFGDLLAKYRKTKTNTTKQTCMHVKIYCNIK